MLVSKNDRVSFYLWHTGQGTYGIVGWGGGGGGGGGEGDIHNYFLSRMDIKRKNCLLYGDTSRI